MTTKKTADGPTTVEEKLSVIQRELKAPKGQWNTFGKYSYRSCEDILSAVKPMLDGAVITLDDEMIAVGDRVYVKAMATLKFAGQSVTVRAYAREAATKKGMDESQITGSASSYARKYALNGLLLIDDTQDADATNNGSEAANRNVSDEGIKSLKGLITETGSDETKLLKYFNAQSLSDLSADQAKEAAGMMKRKQAKAQEAA